MGVVMFKINKKEMSVLFCDIRNFTNLTADLSFDDLNLYLSIFYTHMKEIICRDNEGYIDKYMGDMVMAFWDFDGDLEKSKYFANKACLEIKNSIKELNKKLYRRQLPSIDIGIGISSGLMGVGMLGADDAKDYTVIGNKVNLGARLESLTKDFKVKSIVCEDSLDDNFVYKEIGSPVEKGKPLQTKMFVPICKKSDIFKRISISVGDWVTGDKKDIITHQAKEHFVQNKGAR